MCIKGVGSDGVTSRHTAVTFVAYRHAAIRFILRGWGGVYTMWHVRSSLTRDQARVPSTESTEGTAGPPGRSVRFTLD